METPRYNILVLTAGVGGGHAAAGRALRTELEEAGHCVSLADGLEQMGGVLGWMAVGAYRRGLENHRPDRGLPASWGAVFAVTSRRKGATIVQAIASLPLFTRGLRKFIAKHRPDLVVSTYPLVSAAVGRLCRRGELEVPAATLITDYGAHPLWVPAGMDLHLVPDSLPARLVEEAGGRAAPVRIPTGARRTSAEERVKTRAALGIPEGAFVALVSGGAWGAGSLESAARRALKCGCHVVVATGKNAGLRARLKERLGYLDRVHVLGWRDDLPQILAASDCLIQNAGGMTCLEALDLGVPIISFEPIAGHGQYNARIMEQAGVAVWARTSETLKDLLRPAVRGERPLPRPRREPGLPSAAEALEALVEEFVRKARA